MQKEFLDKLEFYKILAILQTFAKTYIGKKYCLELLPSTEENEIKIYQAETSESLELLHINGSLPIDEMPDVGASLKSLASHNSINIRGLLDIAYILKLAREMKEYFANCEEIAPNISQYFFELYSNEDIEKNIFSKIIDENTIDDKASTKLFSIRKMQKSLKLEIRNKLNTIVHSSTYSKYLQDNVITIRNDRFVLPVKAEFKGEIKGFVHDTSSTGSTLFIEPMSVFELNNQISNLISEENLEIEKILINLSGTLFQYVNNLELSITAIGKLDFIFAKALYSKKIDGTAPIFNNNKIINLISARHPLIDENKVVPIDISIGKDFSTLIITGPNTGGKTVALKTTGLLILMAQSGLHIPAKENSSVCIFDNVFADIGDEQSIAESLSTFSAHMKTIVYIINTASSNSLVLLDELGSGTDPKEGSLLAISILEFLFKQKTLTLATTHYPELKMYALSNDGFKNASFEFNVETLTPTYKLLLGIPGKSNAFAISKKLGLNLSILERANSMLDKQDIDIEDILKGIYDNKLEVEKEKEEISKNLTQIELLRKKLETDFSDLQNKADKIVSDAKIEARNILFSAKDKATSAIKEINNLKVNSNLTIEKDMNNIRNKINDNIKSLSKDNTNVNNTNSIKASDILLGMNVFVIPFNGTGSIISIPDSSNQVQVQIGAIKVKVNISDLIKSDVKENKKSESKITASIVKSSSVAPEINVIGLSVDEALPIIDKYLDDAKIAKLENIRIVHGKGTGRLRAGIHTFLKTHPHVKSFRIGTYGEGEMGVTIVTIA